jgi:precorrin-8X/cobalt-precorrin-8 methylmutase
MEFVREEPPVNIGAQISVRSFERIETEMASYPQAERFDPQERAVISRLIHTTTCFEEVLDHIHFSPEALPRIQRLLQEGANIIVDVNMIKVGLSPFYLETYGNEVICYINEPFTYAHAERNQTTRSYAAVVEAIKRHRDKPMVLVCGNAPTFIYAAINTLLDEGVDLSRVALLLFPVGFVNVVESKAYGKRFSETLDVPAVIMEGRFGGSTLSVATLHAIYKLIKDYDGTTRYNGKK